MSAWRAEKSEHMSSKLLLDFLGLLLRCLSECLVCGVERFLLPPLLGGEGIDVMFNVSVKGLDAITLQR